MRKILKRDGRVVVFDELKIYKAITKAQEASGIVDEPLAKIMLEEVVNNINFRYIDDQVSVESIQDIIEEVLIKFGQVETAKKFILYRAERTRIRESNTRLMKNIYDIAFKDSKDSDIKRENANIDGDTAMGTMLKYGSETSKVFYLDHVIEPRFSKAHINGDIHIHDLDFYSLTTTCCQIDLIKLFTSGFSTGHGHLREPQDIRSYSSLACIAIQANQNDQHGGQSIPNFDYAMANGVRKTYRKLLISNIVKMLGVFTTITKDEATSLINEIETRGFEVRMNNQSFNNCLRAKLANIYSDFEIEMLFNKIVMITYDETKDATYQAMEALIHNLNTMHSRAGAQVPFSSLNYGTDISDEGRMVIECLLDATVAGLGDGETPIFPIQIFKLKEGINYNSEDKNYDLFQKAMFTSSKRMFPNFSFLDAPFNKQYYKEGDYNSEIAYMGCRTRVIANVDKDNEVVSGRGNLSFTSINLPRIALKNKNIDAFFEELERLLELVKDQLLERFKIQSSKKAYNFPFLMGQGIWLNSEKLKYDDYVEEVLKHGTLTIGFIGLAEALKCLTGYHHGESEKAQELGLKIISQMRDACDKYSQEYKLNFSFIATPAEGLSGRFVKIDKKEFGVIKGITDQEFYTNSFHIPVYYNISMFDKIKLEAPYHALTNGGHISYIEVDGDIAKNPKAFETIIRYMHDKGIGYGAINHPIDRDPVCGYNGIINNTCPKCGREEGSAPFERIRRITGYLVGDLDRFNNAKRAEES
ncbi:MAG: anaerobic ribonucleoside triphosphate reductase, partial [Bacilli bacterium]|nr:anaerobic ribonucleoside triphosphate reductase [Bacilli bacterium]